MGRDAHKLRAILGRGATQAPDWDALISEGRYLRITNGVEPERYVGDPNLHPSVFNAKGRPCAGANAQDELNDALNTVTGILNYNAEIEAEERLQKDEEASRSFDNARENLSVHLPSAIHAMCLNVNAVADLYISSIRRRLLTFDNPTTMRSLMPGTSGSNGLHRMLFSGSSGLVFWVFTIKHCLLERILTYLPHERRFAETGSTPWHIFIANAATLTSIRCFSFLLIMNAELQDLQLLPPGTSTTPLPLYTWLRSLARPDRRQFLGLTLIPLYIVHYIYDTAILPHLTHGIASCLDFYQSMGNMLSSSIHDRMVEYKDQKLKNTTSYDLPLRAMLTHARWSIKVVSNMWRMSLNNRLWLHPWLSPSLPTEYRYEPRGPLGSKDVKGGSVAEIHLWPNDLYRRAFVSLAQGVLLFPVAGLASRLAVRWLLRDPAIAQLPQATVVRGGLRSILPGLGLSKVDGFGSFGRLMGQVGMTFLLQTAIKTASVVVESMVALLVSRQRLVRKKRILAADLVASWPITTGVSRLHNLRNE